VTALSGSEVGVPVADPAPSMISGSDTEPLVSVTESHSSNTSLAVASEGERESEDENESERVEAWRATFSTADVWVDEHTAGNSSSGGNSSIDPPSSVLPSPFSHCAWIDFGMHKHGSAR
jgi:hypothetical protein